MAPPPMPEVCRPGEGVALLAKIENTDAAVRDRSTVNPALTSGSSAGRPSASVHSPWVDRSSSSRCLVMVGVLDVVGGSRCL